MKVAERQREIAFVPIGLETFDSFFFIFYARSFRNKVPFFFPSIHIIDTVSGLQEGP